MGAETIERVYRDERSHALATLIRLVGDWDVAEDALHEAFEIALDRWPAEGVPGNPRAWLVSTARFRAIDRLRRRKLDVAKREQLAAELGECLVPAPDEVEPAGADPAATGDDRLRLMFTCCHPALAREAQVALTLRTLGSLSTDEIARAFLVPAPTMAQRLVRAKQKIKAARIPYAVPPPDEWPERQDAVAAVIYLVFNEGYSASAGDALVRRDLCNEAIRLGRLVAELAPDAETLGLLALMLLHDSRRDARTDAAGDLVLLEEQDRSRWHGEQIGEGLALVERALRAGSPGPYALQAAIAALHARATHAVDTDWTQIALLYRALRSIAPSPVIALNHAVAVAMTGALEDGLRLIDALAAGPELASYQFLHAARADLLRRMGRRAEAALAYQAALAVTTNQAERRFLEHRLAQVTG
jgi:RNA polymerase sigma-70 factor (ECF subfamily)